MFLTDSYEYGLILVEGQVNHTHQDSQQLFGLQFNMELHHIPELPIFDHVEFCD